MIAACLCFRDSACYLHEWLLFHSVQGIERFYLYDNESTDDFLAVLRPWLASGRVRLMRWPGLAQQQVIYDDCLGRAQNEGVEWLAFIDDDEFFFACNGLRLREALEPYAAYAGLAVPWFLFGSSGYEHRQPGWVIDTFVRRSALPDSHVKCIVRPQRIDASRVIGHAFSAKPGWSIVEEGFQPITEAQSPAPATMRFRINHYLIKSWEEFHPRRVRPQANTGMPKAHTFSQWKQWDARWCEIEDPGARQFIPAMQILDKILLRR